jgi:hypothetical protein
MAMKPPILHALGDKIEKKIYPTDSMTTDSPEMFSSQAALASRLTLQSSGSVEHAGGIREIALLEC